MENTGYCCVALFLVFDKTTVYEQQRNAALFQWITSEVSFPVVYVRSCERHVSG